LPGDFLYWKALSTFNKRASFAMIKREEAHYIIEVYMKLKCLILLVMLSLSGASMANKIGACWIIPGRGESEKCIGEYTRADCKRIFDKLVKEKGALRPLDFRWFEGFQCPR
jgi:hypothetical protein